MPDTGTPRWLRLFRDDRTGIAFLGGLSMLRGVSYLPVSEIGRASCRERV